MFIKSFITKKDTAISESITQEFLTDEVLKELDRGNYRPKKGLRKETIKSLLHQDFSEKYKIPFMQEDVLKNAIDTAWDIYVSELFSSEREARVLLGKKRLLTYKQTVFFDYLVAHVNNYV